MEQKPPDPVDLVEARLHELRDRAHSACERGDSAALFYACDECAFLQALLTDLGTERDYQRGLELEQTFQELQHREQLYRLQRR